MRQPQHVLYDLQATLTCSLSIGELVPFRVSDEHAALAHIEEEKGSIRICGALNDRSAETGATNPDNGSPTVTSTVEGIVAPIFSYAPPQAKRVGDGSTCSGLSINSVN
jgi:hypothetical protein